MSNFSDKRSIEQLLWMRTNQEQLLKDRPSLKKTAELMSEATGYPVVGGTTINRYKDVLGLVWTAPNLVGGASEKACEKRLRVLEERVKQLETTPKV